MTPQVVRLSGGEVLLLSPAARVLVLHGLAEMARAQRYRNGISPSPLLHQLVAALSPSDAEQPTEQAEYRVGPAQAPSQLSDLINVKEAAVVLHTTPRNVRALCQRGAFESAFRVAGGSWRVSGAEVSARAARRTDVAA